MRIKTSIKKTWNAFLFITALMCLFVFYLSYNHQQAIDKAGVYAINKYVTSNERQYDLTIEDLQTGNLESSINTLNEWELVKKGDRIYPFKRDLMLNLSLALYKLNKYNDLALLTEKWRRLDKRDVTAMAFYYEALRHHKIEHKKGINGLVNTYEKFPKNTYLKKFYNAALSSNAISLQ